MVEIEFLDPDEPPPGLDTAGGEEIGSEPVRRAPPDRTLVAACVLLAGAAALAVAAPFQDLLVIRQQGAGRSVTFAADGWGRLFLGARSDDPGPLHFSRFGIPLVICAALLMVVVAGLLAAAARAPLPDRVLRFGGFAAAGLTGVLAGLVFAMWLLVAAQFGSTPTSTVDVELGAPSPPQFQYGACIWLSAASVVASALGLGAAGRWHRERRSGRHAERHG
ncbi:MAG: hypothetical protein ABR571_09015 [Jatrophihabitans sp.]|uniref:hypothetical protein n=1 Tax=Jatrophihabitans sp. TaxID=1932789 RepID=UPI00391156FC